VVEEEGGKKEEEEEEGNKIVPLLEGWLDLCQAQSISISSSSTTISLS